MKGRIDPSGNLLIERHRDMKHAECPFQHGRICSDTCALFHEPEPEMVWQCFVDEENNPHDEKAITGKTKLQLCHALWFFDEFTDERA